MHIHAEHQRALAAKPGFPCDTAHHSTADDRLRQPHRRDTSKLTVDRADDYNPPSRSRGADQTPLTKKSPHARHGPGQTTGSASALDESPRQSQAWHASAYPIVPSFSFDLRPNLALATIFYHSLLDLRDTPLPLLFSLLLFSRLR
jgi:glyoxylase-like metal-dependent hydrolase (beta-lactamase superfamily II)